jgi:hypothetical protein
MRAGSRTLRAEFAGPGEGGLTGVTDDPGNTLPPVAESSSALGGQANERELLTGYLDWYRSVVEGKVADLSLLDASRVMTPSGLSPLGIVKHLGYVERSWFSVRFAAAEEKPLWAEDDPDADFRIESGETVASVVHFYRAATDDSRRIAARASLDDLSQSVSPHYGTVSLRWILVHMLEETARHAGHLDLMREQIDGRTGD